MKKDLDYYMSLPYVIEVVPIPDSEGGGYTAQLPQVGRFAIVGDGETPEEAIADLENTKRLRFAAYLEKGVEIPEPEPEKEEFSGRFVIRLPKILHRHLSGAAKSNRVSLNQYTAYLLSTNLQLDISESYFNSIMDEITHMSEAIWSWGIGYSFLIKHKDDQYPEYENEFEKQEIPDILKAA